MKRLKQFGIVGAAISGTLCFTPLLAIGLGTFGLGAFMLYAAIALGIIFMVTTGFLFWNWTTKRKAT